ncbi:mRNA-degrading endonuclease toxin of MazEF toxin-antitoxin module [Bacillus mesophilus]|nr:type II toxin-antitoxin system PemK/MazF family toxin [Bacillus mesophilus]MBM7662816.1 mRNA-degrading endonuclease toxin of MazEF toxin-antitoxin module [Bacillus mesophilus]
MSNLLKQGDVWLVNVLFEDKNECKQRPVLIIGNG